MSRSCSPLPTLESSPEPTIMKVADFWIEKVRHSWLWHLRPVMTGLPIRLIKKFAFHSRQKMQQTPARHVSNVEMRHRWVLALLGSIQSAFNRHCESLPLPLCFISTEHSTQAAGQSSGRCGNTKSSSDTTPRPDLLATRGGKDCEAPGQADRPNPPTEQARSRSYK